VRIVGWRCIPSHQDQYWKVYTSYPVADEIYDSVIDLNSGDVIGVSGNSTANGAAVVQWPYQSLARNQFWTFSPDAIQG
jgi:hypothetical protein